MDSHRTRSDRSHRQVNARSETPAEDAILFHLKPGNGERGPGAEELWLTSIDYRCGGHRGSGNSWISAVAIPMRAFTGRQDWTLRQ